MCLQTVQTMRAVRDFKPEPVPEAVLRQIVDAGRRAQSSHNDQPWHFILIRERETLRQLSECGKYAGHLAGAAFAVALVTRDRSGFDLGQAAAYMQLAAWSLGVGSCLASMWEPERARAILGVPDNLIFDTAISFGYPAKPPRPLRAGGRRPFGEVVRWEQWAQDN